MQRRQKGVNTLYALPSGLVMEPGANISKSSCKTSCTPLFSHADCSRLAILPSEFVQSRMMCSEAGLHSDSSLATSLAKLPCLMISREPSLASSLFNSRNE